MTKEKAPTRRQRLNLNLGGFDNSINPNKPTLRNRDQVLEELAQKWSSRGFYRSPSRAMIALLEGVQ